jgi:hypothetical protein
MSMSEGVSLGEIELVIDTTLLKDGNSPPLSSVARMRSLALALYM